MALMDGLQFNPRTHCFESPGEFARRFFHQLGDALGSIPTPPGAIVCCDEDALMEDFGNDDLDSACAEICTMCGAPEEDCRCYDPHDDENTKERIQMLDEKGRHRQGGGYPCPAS